MIHYLDFAIQGQRLGSGHFRAPRVCVEFRMASISDLHLLTRSSLAHDAREFLKHTRLQHLYAVGDMVDCQYKNRVSMLELVRFMLENPDNKQLAFVKTVQGMAEEGVDVAWPLGNHELSLEPLIGTISKDRGISIHNELTHITLNGERCLLLHGHEFNSSARSRAFLDYVGAQADGQLSKLSRFVDRCRQNSILKKAAHALGLHPDQSLAVAVKSGADGWFYRRAFQKVAVEHMFNLNKCIFENWRRNGSVGKPPYYDKLICGHTHFPERFEARSPITPEGGCLGPPTIEIINIGSWVGKPDPQIGDDAWRDRCFPPPCTAAVETMTGKIDLVIWDPRYGIKSYVPPRADLAPLWPR